MYDPMKCPQKLEPPFVRHSKLSKVYCSLCLQKIVSVAFLFIKISLQSFITLVPEVFLETFFRARDSGPQTGNNDSLSPLRSLQSLLRRKFQEKPLGPGCLLICSFPNLRNHQLEFDV